VGLARRKGPGERKGTTKKGKRYLEAKSRNLSDPTGAPQGYRLIVGQRKSSRSGREN